MSDHFDDAFARDLDRSSSDSDERRDHLFSSHDFMDRYAQPGVLRSVSPSSCPPGVTPAVDELPDMGFGAFRLAPPPQFPDYPVGRATRRSR
jgi:hypothetical protein